LRRNTQLLPVSRAVKLAVVYHLPNPGGITRFTHALIDGLLTYDRELTIDYYVCDRLLNEGRLAPFSDADRVRTIGINDPEVVDSNIDEPTGHAIVRWTSRRLSGHPLIHDAIRRPYGVLRDGLRRAFGRQRGKHWHEYSLTPDVVAALAAYDVVYFPFPYHLEPVSIAAPVVGTFHDFNHLYFRSNFGGTLVRQVDRQLRFWTTRADAAVVSTRFVERDLLSNYPGAAGRSSVVYVAPYSFVPLSESARVAAVARFGLRDQGYVVYPSNHSYHKNLLGLVRAADIIKKREGQIANPVVFTGFGTDGLGARKWPSFAEVDEYLSTSSLVLGEDIRGLGFVTDEEVDALTQSARLVASTSLYEAGCGPALDAWQFGVPVAFSNIPPFVEQLDALGVEAWTFDPRDPEDIARVIWRALTEREESLAMAARSREAIKRYTWNQAAQGYMRVFGQAIDHYRTRLPVATEDGLPRGSSR
jgi:glycosyltransferase involved in cell wall biosynthesis